MTHTTPTAPSRMYTITVVLCSLVIALPMLFGKLIEAAIEAANPADVDVSQDLAYLRELLGFSFGFLGLVLLVIAAMLVTLYRRRHTIALPVIVLVVQLVVGLLVLLMTGVVDGIEDAYASTLV